MITTSTPTTAEEATMSSTTSTTSKPSRTRTPKPVPAETPAETPTGLAEYQRRRAAAAERAAAKKAEREANPPAPPKGRNAEARDKARKEQSERVAKVIEMRKAGKKLGEIALELGYTSQQVVSAVLKRHAPELQVQRTAVTLTPKQVEQLQKIEADYGVSLATLARALHTATKGE